MQSANDGFALLAHRDNGATPPNKTPNPPPTTPYLRLRLFHPSERTSDKGTVDIVVVYMFGSNADDSDISIFVRDEKAESRPVPPVIANQETGPNKGKPSETQQRRGEALGGPAKPPKKPIIEKAKYTAATTGGYFSLHRSRFMAV
jgi:hypothetical protein